MNVQVELSNGDVSLGWDIESVTDAANGRYLLLDGEAQPRLIVTPEELREVAAHGAV